MTSDPAHNRSVGSDASRSLRLLVLGTVLLLPAMLAPAGPMQAQQTSYELHPAPDLWYNDVDGIRIGLRVRGQVPGTFEDGPHRLDTGLWLGAWWPDHPVSYYFSFTEPIRSLSDFASEASVRVESSARTGLHRHGLSFNKRWQTGFDESSYREVSLFARAEQRFDLEYPAYRTAWQRGWLWLGGITLENRGSHGAGPWMGRLHAVANLAGEEAFFAHSALELQQKVSLGASFALHARLFGGIASVDAPRQYRFLRSMRSPVHWTESGLTRARGTLPRPWLADGFIQVSGGANLRGYTWQEIHRFNAAEEGDGDAIIPARPPLVHSMASLNLELEYPNPIGRLIRSLPVIGGVTELRSYLFFDTGTSPGTSGTREEKLLADGGAGFMLVLNIPDYLGKPRGFMLRYDLPLWLSRPGDENAFKFRNIVGLGAVISL